jgi:hypothetical protein
MREITFGRNLSPRERAGVRGKNAWKYDTRWITSTLRTNNSQADPRSRCSRSVPVSSRAAFLLTLSLSPGGLCTEKGQRSAERCSASDTDRAEQCSALPESLCAWVFVQSPPGERGGRRRVLVCSRSACDRRVRKFPKKLALNPIFSVPPASRWLSEKPAGCRRHVHARGTNALLSRVRAPYSARIPIHS